MKTYEEFLNEEHSIKAKLLNYINTKKYPLCDDLLGEKIYRYLSDNNVQVFKKHNNCYGFLIDTNEVLFEFEQDGKYISNVDVILNKEKLEISYDIEQEIYFIMIYRYQKSRH